MKERFIVSVENRRIVGDVYFPPLDAPPFVITSHGLYSTKESDKFTEIAGRFTQKGLAVVLFDYGGCGESTGHIADTTVSGRFLELEEVARFAAAHRKLGSRFGILGSSFGGFLALLYAAKHHVDALCVWATPYKLYEIYDNISEEDLQLLKKDFFTDALTYDLSTQLEKIKAVQIIQGKNDEVVPWQHAHEIFSRVREPKKVAYLPQGNHSITDPEDRSRSMDISLAWFLEHVT